METEHRLEQINCRHREYEKENRRQTKRLHEIAEIFDDLTDEFMNMSRGVCEEEDWMSIKYLQKFEMCVDKGATDKLIGLGKDVRENC